jgi:hypothetical protein
MSFKGRSKSLGIYPPKIMVFSPNKGDRNLFAIELFKLLISIDIDNLNFEGELYLERLQSI